MSHERHDEFISWRKQLGSPGALPEQGLDDKELTWQRLAERLRERPRRRWTGYWIAAACFLLAVIPAARFFHDRPARPGRIALRPSPRPQTIAGQSPSRHVPDPASQPMPGAPAQVHHPRSAAAAPAPTPAAPPPAAASPANTALTTPPVTPPPVATLPVATSSAPARPAETDAATTSAAASATVSSPPATPSTEIQVSPPANMPDSRLNPAPPKRQLKIVYLNEINGGAHLPDPAVSRDQRFLRLLTAGKAPGDWATGTDKNDAPQIKIELSSPNH